MKTIKVDESQEKKSKQIHLILLEHNSYHPSRLSENSSMKCFVEENGRSL